MHERERQARNVSKYQTGWVLSMTCLNLLRIFTSDIDLFTMCSWESCWIVNVLGQGTNDGIHCQMASRDELQWLVHVGSTWLCLKIGYPKCHASFSPCFNGPLAMICSSSATWIAGDIPSPIHCNPIYNHGYETGFSDYGPCMSIPSIAYVIYIYIHPLII
jgi:hypothetical protein